MIRPIPYLVPHLWYPILVKIGDQTHIVEMQGWEVNEWNYKLITTRPPWTLI